MNVSNKPTPSHDNIPESSFGTVNSELTASDSLLQKKKKTTSILTSTGVQNSKTRCVSSLLHERHRNHRLNRPVGTIWGKT